MSPLFEEIKNFLITHSTYYKIFLKCLWPSINYISIYKSYKLISRKIINIRLHTLNEFLY